MSFVYIVFVKSCIFSDIAFELSPCFPSSLLCVVVCVLSDRGNFCVDKTCLYLLCDCLRSLYIKFDNLLKLPLNAGLVGNRISSVASSCFDCCMVHWCTCHQSQLDYTLFYRVFLSQHGQSTLASVFCSTLSCGTSDVAFPTKGS